MTLLAWVAAILVALWGLLWAGAFLQLAVWAWRER